MKPSGDDSAEPKKHSPVVYELEAIRLARDVFPKIKESQTVCSSLRYYASQNGYAYGTFRRKYYNWLQECERRPEGNGAWAIIDGRSLRAGLVREEQFFKDVLNAYQRRKTFKAAYDEVLAEYAEMGLRPPCGCSLTNLVRHKERLGSLFTPHDTPRCDSCNELWQRLASLLDELVALQKNCTNCDKLL